MSIRFKLSPELVDGDHWTVVDTIRQLCDYIELWDQESQKFVGEGFAVEVVEMSDEEVAALPEIG